MPEELDGLEEAAELEDAERLDDADQLGVLILQNYYTIIIIICRKLTVRGCAAS